jgi:GNAT superfamily N-acetyltransferase
MGDVRVVSASDKKARSDFIKVPFGIFRNDPNWVPPLDFERHEHLDAKKNPYFRHADTELFLACRNGEAVGRISAQIDHLRNERYKDKTGQFGFFDVPDDLAVSQPLLSAAEAWLVRRGMTRIQGPFSFSINDETGLLVAGFDRPPSVMMGHSRPYMAGHLEAAGFAKAKDVIAYDYDATRPLPRAMQAMVDKVKRSGDLVVRPFSKRQLRRDLDIIMRIFNDAWSENWGFVPFTPEELTALGNNLKILVKNEYIAIAEYRGEAAAMAVSLPDINGWVADLNGKLLPLGWAKLAWRLLARPPRSVRIPLMGVLKKHQGTAVGSALALSVIDEIRRYHVGRGTTRAELSWILEDNLPMRRIIESLGAIPYKTYRVYEKSIG